MLLKRVTVIRDLHVNIIHVCKHESVENHHQLVSLHPKTYSQIIIINIIILFFSCINFPVSGFTNKSVRLINETMCFLLDKKKEKSCFCYSTQVQRVSGHWREQLDNKN